MSACSSIHHKELMIANHPRNLTQAIWFNGITGAGADRRAPVRACSRARTRAAAAGLRARLAATHSADGLRGRAPDVLSK